MARFVLCRAADHEIAAPAFVACLATALPAHAVDLPLGIQLHGAIDLYVDGNFNAPPDRANFLPGTGTTAKLANQFSLNLASIELVKAPEPVGFHLWLVAGTGTDVEHEGEFVGPNTGSQVWRYVQQASISARIPWGRGLEIEGGIYPSHIGFEGFASQTDWNYTRAWLGEYSPYYQTGIKATYAFDDSWSAQIQVLNGWQRIGDNNNGKSFGTQVVWKAGPSTLAFNTFLGPELTDDDSNWRYFVDFVWTLQLTLQDQIALCLDWGLQQMPQAPRRYLVRGRCLLPAADLAALGGGGARRVLPRSGGLHDRHAPDAGGGHAHRRVQALGDPDAQARGPVRSLHRPGLRGRAQAVHGAAQQGPGPGAGGARRRGLLLGSNIDGRPDLHRRDRRLLRRQLGLHPRLRPLAGEPSAMNLDDMLGSIVAVLLTVYLVYALVRAERF